MQNVSTTQNVSRIRYGCHVNKTSPITGKQYKTILDAIKNADIENGIVQIFTHGPRNMSRNSIDYDELAEYCDASDIRLVVHATYVSIKVWSTPNNTYISHILDMYQSCVSLGAYGLVIHLPAAGSVQGIADVMVTLSDRILSGSSRQLSSSSSRQHRPYILLELPTSTCTYVRLPALITALKSRKDLMEWGICLDTAHMYSSGIANVNAWLSSIDMSVVKLLHVNGLHHNMYNTRKDTHLIPMEPNDGVFTDKSFKEFRTQYEQVPSIFEINRGEKKYLDQLIDCLEQISYLSI
jgi:endonuclease IV